MSAARAPLTRPQLRDLERELRSARARMERSMSAQAGLEGAPAPPGSARRAPAHADGGLAVELEARTLARHEALVEALRRLEAGTYGVCVSCREPIPYGRLLVMPEAARCVTCGARA